MSKAVTKALFGMDKFLSQMSQIPTTEILEFTTFEQVPHQLLGISNEEELCMLEKNMTEPIVLTAAQVNTASHVLGRAFQDDPLMVYLLPDAGKRKRLLPALFRVVARYCQRYGVVYTTSDLDALICCLVPGRPASIGRLILTGLSAPPVRIGLGGLRRFLHASTYTDEAHERTITGAHWYVWVLGVEPGCQGQGLGGKLLQTVLQQATIQHLPCYLETENPRNLPFYQRHGFRLVSEATIAGSDVHVYALLWEPDSMASAPA